MGIYELLLVTAFITTVTVSSMNKGLGFILSRNAYDARPSSTGLGFINKRKRLKFLPWGRLGGLVG